MKRIITLLVIAVMCASIATAQEHLKFMGIPLNGTITQFQAKLAKKGVTVDAQLSKALGAGTRAYKGTFAGEKAENIFVYYNVKTKIVYRAKAVFVYNDIAEQKRTHYRDLLDVKYGAVNRTSLSDPDGFRYSLDNGCIDLYLTDEFLSMRKSLHIDYIDGINDLMNDYNTLNDL